MEFITKSKIIPHKILNEATGELEVKDFMEVEKRSRLKGGFNLMYHKSYEEITEKVINSNKDLRLFNWITNQFTYARVESLIIYSACNIGISQSQFAKMVKKLMSQQYIIRVARGIYRLNPYTYVPFRANAEELQREWTEIVNDNKMIEEMKD